MSRLEKFLGLYSSESTKRSYRNSLQKFFDFVYPGDEVPLAHKVERYFEEGREITSDIQKFNASIAELPPKTSHLYISAVKNLFIENGVEFETRFWRRIRDRRKGTSTRARTIDEVPSNKQLKRIVTHMPVDGKALYLLLASSGMRIGEAMQLKLDDLDLENNKATVRAEYTKTGNSRIAFFSDECKEYLKEWLSQRDNYLKTKNGRTPEEYETNMDDGRLFPFTLHNAYAVWRIALKKTDNDKRDKSTDRYTVHPHVLRKFFRTRMATLIPVDVVEALMGHEGYLTEVYRRYTQEDLKEFYKQGEQSVTVVGSADIMEMKEKFESQRQEFNEQQKIINHLNLENISLKEHLEHHSERIEKLENVVDFLMKTMKEREG